MSRLIIVPPLPIAGVTASRGSGADNLLTHDPKEVWADSEAGSYATLIVDLGGAQVVDTILVGYVRPPADAATWVIYGGTDFPTQTVITEGPLRVPDVAGDAPPISHALWHGSARSVRYLAILLTQPAGSPPLTAGVLVIGKAFVAQLGQEWGSGRQPIDTGTATALSSGGFSVVEGARKKLFSWTFGDLTVAEADQLDVIAGNLGETAPALVVEDPDQTAGLRARIHYGLFRKWTAYERRNRQQTRWELAIEQWI